MADAENGQFIYIAEDEEPIRLLYKAVLDPLYNLKLFPDGYEAYEAIKECPDKVGLLITDRNMPRLNGEELIMLSQALFLAQKPPRTVRALMISGSELNWDPMDLVVVQRMANLNTVVIGKPLGAAQLREAVANNFRLDKI